MPLERKIQRMPEAPDLEYIREFLGPIIIGQEITNAREVKPLVLRDLTGTGLPKDAPGRKIEDITRHGKLLFIKLSGDRIILVNPMLTGGLRYGPPSERILASTHVIFGFGNDMELRYFDQKKMGMVYYLREDQISQTPRVEEQGPDVLDEPLTEPEFRQALKPFRGEIKGILTRGRLVSGVGNAYADEILHSAGIFPFKKRNRLSDEELARLHKAVYEVPLEALEKLRESVGNAIHKKDRSFLKVHRRGGKPCPDCRYEITAITANKRETNFCRKCQPGLMIRN